MTIYDTQAPIHGTQKQFYKRYPRGGGYQEHRLTAAQLQEAYDLHDAAIRAGSDSRRQLKMDWHFRAQIRQLLQAVTHDH
jgi:hypothetical protein